MIVTGISAGLLVLTILLALPWLLGLAIPLALALTTPVFIPMLGLNWAGRMISLWFGSFSQRQMQILIVDDDAISVIPLINALSDRFTKVNLVENGYKMIEALRKGNIDLVFLDQKMPEICGNEALQIGETQLPSRKRVPVVFFSDYAKELNLPEYKKFEIKGIWDKHVPFSELNQKIDSFFKEAIPA